MKKSLKIVALALILIMTFSASVFAQSAVMTGKTDVGAKGVTVLVVKKGATIQTMTGDDIVWIDQQNVQADGSFSIKLPIYSDTEYDVFSNATSKNVEEARIYVSQTGTGNGLSADSPTTLAEAYSQIDDDLEIVITEDMTYEDASAEYTGNLTIRGLSGTEKLTLPEIVSVKGNLKFDDIVLKTSSKLYANGYNLEIGENIKSDTLTVYGGKDGVSCKNTSLKIYGGTYGYIYGGGHHSGGKVTGSTNVVFGGNATAEYIHGAGCEAVASKTNITISGGVVNESVYGGMAGVPLAADTNILMTGGTVQSLYGGNSVTNLTGNTYITVKGGEVTRRIYGGCYNEYKFSWDSDGYVKGSTNIIIYPTANLITGSGLSLSDRTNMGIFGGSRRKADTEDEVNTIIFMDGSFDKYGSNVVKSGTLKSFHDYLVKSAVGGSVSPIENGKVVVNTKNGITALSNGARYQNGQTIILSAETTITYDGIISADIEETTATTKANADVAVSSSAVLFAAVNDDFDLKCKRSGDDLTYELKIKWSELFGYEYDPQRGNVLGFSVLINENDDGVSRKGWMEYGSGIGNKADASLFFVMPLLDFNKKDDEIKVLLNETKLDFDVQPVFVENKILLPLRTVLENLGANVSWNSEGRIAIAEKQNTVSEIPIGRTEFFVNGKSYIAQMPAQLINGRTLVSEDVLELVGECIIDCDMEKSTVTIMK